MLKKRLTNKSDLDSDEDEDFNQTPAKLRKRESKSIVTKIINRSKTGFFNSSIRNKSNMMAFNIIPSDLKFCLKDIIPFCYCDGHIFMGLTACGNFMISYKRMSCELSAMNYDFSSGYKYELFFWIYRPHMPLSKYFTVNLFDDHGAEDIKCVNMTQWFGDNRTLIIHGSSELDDQHSFLSIVRVPSLGCLDCRAIRESETSDPFNSHGLCIKCNLTIHTKYRYNENTQKFQPKIHLNSPNYIIMCENSLIHTINVRLDMQRVKNIGTNVISEKYMRKSDSTCEENLKNVEVGQSYGVEAPLVAHVPKKISIVEQILADFSEYDAADSPLSDPSTANEETNNVIAYGCENFTLRVGQTIPKKSTTPKDIRKTDYGETSSRLINCPKSASPPSPELLEAAAKTYEFSEDNEKYEKISIFRKRRLADKKYEFSEDNSENIIPFNRTRSKILRNVRQQFEVPIHTHRASPSYGFRSPCGSPVTNRSIRSPSGFRSPNYAYRSSPTHPFLSSPPARHFARMSGNMSPANSVDDVQKYFTDIMNRIRDNRSESGNESTHDDVKPLNKDVPLFSKKIINYYVEEDDANSVVTCEEDDCISPGYHLSLPMEVHAACYAKMQIVSKASLSRLKGVPRAIVTQNSFDIETFSIHIANLLCKKNNKKYGILFDLAFEIIHVCPLSHKVVTALILQFTANEFDRHSQCFNCSNDSDCFTHRKLYEGTILFQWQLTGLEWKILDFGQMKQLSGQMKLSHPVRGNRQEMLIRKLQRFTKRIFGRDRMGFDLFDHLRVLDSNEEKSKDSLIDLHNGIEFFRRQPFESPSSVSSLSSNSSLSDSSDSEQESIDDQLISN